MNVENFNIGFYFTIKPTMCSPLPKLSISTPYKSHDQHSFPISGQNLGNQILFVYFGHWHWCLQHQSSVQRIPGWSQTRRQGRSRGFVKDDLQAKNFARLE
jgi:hypothetical protein